MKYLNRNIEDLKNLFLNIASKNEHGDNLHKFKKKEVIFAQEELASSFIFIVSGKVSIVREHDDSDFVVSTLGSGAVVGEMGLFVSEKTRTTSIIVNEDVVGIVVDYDTFMSYIEKDSRPLLYLTSVMAERLYLTTKSADSVATMNVRDRLINLLSSMCENPLSKTNEDGSCTFKMSRKEMSSRIGCSRELAGKTLKQLRQEGKVFDAGMKITVFKNISEG
jgi:CRP-like cAMP-binding protein